MGTVSKYGRTFEFDDDTPADVQERRIQNWMEQHAADELEKPAAKGPAKSGKSWELPTYLKAALAPVTGGLAALPTDQLRVMAQGALPFSDEIIAGARSLAGQDYDTALADERKELKDFERKYGTLANTLTELTGAGLTIPLLAGTGAAMRVPQAMSWLGRTIPGVAKYPRIARYLTAAATGAGAGAFSGFGAGEDGLDDRLQNAAEVGALGAALGPATVLGVDAAKVAGNWLWNRDSKLGNYLRKRLISERGDELRTRGAPLLSSGEVDPMHPDFKEFARQDLNQELARQRNLSVDPMLADVLPGTTEAALQKSGPRSANLAKELTDRQYNDRLNEQLARDTSQSGRVKEAFEHAFGPNAFRDTEDAIIAQRAQLADQAFHPAFQHNIRSAAIDDALNDPYVQRAWGEAVNKMQSERKPIGIINPVNNSISQYNTEFLHKIKRTLDDMATAARERPEGSTGRDTARIIGGAKNRLNDAMMAANPEYQAAMAQYGEQSEWLDALRKGREAINWTKDVDATGRRSMSAQDIRDYLADASIPDIQKDLFKLGAARGLHQQFIGSSSTKFGHNWAKFIESPEVEEKMSALLTDKLGAWNLLRSQLRQESKNYKQVARAMTNSRTNVRQELVKEMEGDLPPGELAAAAINPGAPTSVRRLGAFAATRAHINNPEWLANRTADILSGRGSRAANRSSVQRLYDVLDAADRSNARYSAARYGLPPVVAASPWFRDREQTE